jgi:pimeloyl-ACP methyl ester carboxylesterase
MHEDIARIAAGARRLHSEGGDGPLVWHVWGRGAPVLLLHGGSGSWTHWLRNVQPLVDAGRSVWAPDLPGMGDSAKPPGCDDADDSAPWLERGLQQLLGAQAVDAFGFSYGGLVAGYWAAASPARFNSLLLVGAPGLSVERRQPLPMRAWSELPEGERRDAVHRHNLGVLMIAEPAAIDAAAIALHGANVRRDRMRRRRLMLTDALLQLLPRIACPLAGLWGEHDALYRDRLATLGPALARAPQYRELTLLPGAGHWVPYEAAAAFNAQALRWLNAVAEDPAGRAANGRRIGSADSTPPPA